jgi:hypothetical protein
MLVTKFKFIILTLILSLVAACSKVEKATDLQSATFYSDAIEGTSEISNVDNQYLIPKSRLYNLKSCLKDIVQSKSINSQEFKISGPSFEKIARTDDQGCLNWSEEIDYNFIENSTFLKLIRKITSIGVHKGAINVSFVLNPWSHGENLTGIIDPSKKDVSSLVKNLEGKSAFISSEPHSPLWMLNPRISIIEKEFTSSGAMMNLKIQSKLALILKNSNMQNVQYPISNGHFKVEAIIFNSFFENGKETLVEIANISKEEVGFNQDLFFAEIPFELSTLPTKGQVHLAIKVSAPNNNLGLDPFKGVFLISDSPKVKVDSTPTPTDLISFDQVRNKFKIVSDNQINDQSKVSNNSSTLPGLEIDKLEIKFFKIGSETTTDRQVFYTIKSCIKSNLDARPIREVEFTVSTSNKKFNITTNQDGCFSFDESIWHKFFGKEQFFKNSITVENSNYKLNKKIDYLINPWDMGANFGRDTRFVEDLGSLKSNPSNEKPKILFENYSFSVNKYNYEISKSLDLSIIKNGLLSLSAKVVNHSSLSSGRLGSEHLRDGKYLLKWAFVTLNKDDKVDSVISTNQKVISVFGGEIKTEIGVKVSAFEKLNVRSRLIVALYTVKENKNKIIEIDKNSGLEATPYMATIILDNDQDSQKMQAVEDNLGLAKGDIFEKLSSFGNGNSNPSDAFSRVLKLHNLKLVNLSNEKDSLQMRDGLANPTKFYTKTFNAAYFHEADQLAPINTSILNNFIISGKLSTDLAAKFCSFWFNDHLARMKSDSPNGIFYANYKNSLVSTCINAVRNDPSQFFQVDKKLMVKKVGGFKYLSGTTTNFSVGTSFSIARSEATTKTQTFSWTASAGISFDFLDIFKVGSTGSYALSKANSNSDTNSNNSSVSSSTYLNLQTSSFDINLSSYEECVSIRLNPDLFSGKNSKYISLVNDKIKSQEIARAITSGYFICSGIINNTPITKQESYYLVNQGFRSSHGEQDDHSVENQQFFMTFRGQRDLNLFLNTIQSSVSLPSSVSSFDKNTNNTRNSLVNGLSLLPTFPGAFSENK